MYTTDLEILKLNWDKDFLEEEENKLCCITAEILRDATIDGPVLEGTPFSLLSKKSR